MAPVEVLAVEIHQYAGQGVKMLVPKVIGQTADAQARKGTIVPTRLWDEPTSFAALEKAQKPEVVRVARSIFDWAV